MRFAPASPWKKRASVLSLFLTLGIALSLLLSITIQPPLSRNDMPGGSYHSEGIFNPRPTLYGLLDPQTGSDGTTYSWSTAHATVTFPYEAYLGRYADVRLRVASLRKPGQTPALLTVSLNAVAYPPFTVPGDFTEYSFRLDTRQSPNPYLDPAHIQLDIESTTVISTAVSVPAPEGNDRLGVAVDWIELQPQRDTRDVLLMLAAWLVGLALVLAIALRRLSLRWAAAYGAGALVTFAILTLTYVIRPFPSAYEVGLAGLAWAVAAALAPVKRPVVGLALAVLCLWIVLAGRVLVDWQTDDSYISYRYAWNLMHGQGLVYNPGDAVEGYTNFLWTLLAALFIGAGFHPAGLMLASIVAFSVGLAGLTYYLGQRLSGGSFIWPLFAVGLLAVDSSFITYGPKGSGLEATPFAFLVLLPVALLWRGSKGGAASRGSLVAGGVVLALASLTRPEGLAVAALFFGVKAWQVWSASSRLKVQSLPSNEVKGSKAEDQSSRLGGAVSDGRRVWSILAACVLPFLAIFVPYQVWRISFYGYLFPNTFYAKTDTTLAFLVRGWTYTWQFVMDHWFIVLLVVAGAGVWLAQIMMRMLKSFRLGQGAVRRGVPPAHPHSETVASPELERLPVGEADESAKWTVRALAGLSIFYTLYIIAVGGDHFPEGRFFVPLAAPLALLGQRMAYMLTRWGGQRLVSPGARPAGHTPSWVRSLASSALWLGTVCYVVTALWLQDPHGELSARTKRDTNFVNIWGSAGLWLRDHTPQDTLAASPVAGAIAFYSQRPVVDMLGITDEHIAHKQVANMGTGLAGHEKEDPAYVLDRKPIYILPYPDYFTPIQKQFDSQYITTTVRGPLGPDIVWWQRRSGAGELDLSPSSLPGNGH